RILAGAALVVTLLVAPEGFGAPVTGTSAAASSATAFLHANVAPMDSERVLRDQTVVVTGGRIQAVGPSASTAVPPGARRIDCAGGWLVPGLADMHVHVNVPEELTLYAVNGVTTVFNLDGHPAHLA